METVEKERTTPVTPRILSRSWKDKKGYGTKKLNKNFSTSMKYGREAGGEKG